FIPVGLPAGGGGGVGGRCADASVSTAARLRLQPATLRRTGSWFDRIDRGLHRRTAADVAAHPAAAGIPCGSLSVVGRRSGDGLGGQSPGDPTSAGGTID